MKKKKTHELRRRLFFSLAILVIYMAGRSLLLYHVDPAAYQLEELDSQNILISMISGGRYRCTIFALGIMPYIMASLLMWIFMALGGSAFKSRFSPQKTERITLIAAVIIAAAYAVPAADDLVFKSSALNIGTLKAIAIVELVIGAIIIYKMAAMNREHGVGAQTPIILVNILDNLFSTIQKFTWEDLQRPLVLCLIMAGVILIVENIIIHIPVQRVSIHNSYADKSYIAFKFNPIGVMPVMFALTFFMLPQLVLRLLLTLEEDNGTLQILSQKMNLGDALGAAVYLGIIFALNVIFSFIMLSPGDMADQLQKGGDSIVGVYAGRKTKRYLRRKLLLLTILSSCVLCLMIGASLRMAMMGRVSPELALFPTTGMMLVGMLCPLYREIKAYRKFDSYSFFI